MKKLLLTLLTLLAFGFQAKAMSFEQARHQALFLTDKMAYELNLTDDQYEAAYEINLDYLLSIDHYDDLYGIYWRRRNQDWVIFYTIGNIGLTVKPIISTAHCITTLVIGDSVFMLAILIATITILEDQLSTTLIVERAAGI